MLNTLQTPSERVRPDRLMQFPETFHHPRPLPLTSPAGVGAFAQKVARPGKFFTAGWCSRRSDGMRPDGRCRCHAGSPRIGPTRSAPSGSSAVEFYRKLGQYPATINRPTTLRLRTRRYETGRRQVEVKLGRWARSSGDSIDQEDLDGDFEKNAKGGREANVNGQRNAILDD